MTGGSTRSRGAEREVGLRYGRGRLTVRVPEAAAVLESAPIPALADPEATVRRALRSPIGTRPLRSQLEERRPRSVVITMSDITRPVPNQLIQSALLEELSAAGIQDAQCTVLIATGMHRPSTVEERLEMLGPEILRRCRVVDHRADAAETLVRVSEDPPVSVNRLYAEAEFKIVTGLIEPHFMAGYSGGRKGICPGLVDLETIRRFHGFRTMGNPAATEGKLEGNPCHEIAVQLAREVGCDFLVNAAVDHERRPAGIFAGDLFEAHEVGCKQVEQWVQVETPLPFDLVVTCAGGYPLDPTFYQSVKGMVTALPALRAGSTLMVLSACEAIGSPEYESLMMRYGDDHTAFLRDIETSGRTTKDQWQYQLHARVLELIGRSRIWWGNDALPIEVQARLGVTPLPGEGSVEVRAQAAIDRFLASDPEAHIAVIPEGPHAMLRAADSGGRRKS